MTENSNGPRHQIGELFKEIGEAVGTVVNIFGFAAGSVGLLYAVGFTIVNLALLKHGVYEVSLVRARYVSAGVSHIVLISLLAWIVWTCLSQTDRLSKDQSWWFKLLISFIPIFLVCYLLAMAVWGFRAVSERDITAFDLPFFIWCLVFSLFLLLMMESDRIPKVKDLRSKLESGGTGASMSFGERLSAIGVWSIVVVIFIVLLYFYGQDVYETFPSALGGGQPIVVQFTGEESSLAALEQIGITQLENGLTDKVELIAQTEDNYIVLVHDTDLKTDLAISFEKSFTKGIKYYPEEHFLSPEYRKEKYTAEGNNYIKGGDFDTAGKMFDKALRLDDAYVPALLGKGNVLIGLLKYDQAIKFYNTELIGPDKELELKEEDLASAHYGLARAYAGKRRFEEAMNALKQAFVMDETLLETAQKDKIFYADNELLKEIFEGYENAAKWFGQEGDKLRESGDLDGSIEMYKKAISLSQETGDKKSEADYRYRLSKVYTLKGDIMEARNEIETATNLDPNNLVYQIGLADIYVAQTEFESAISLYESVLANNPDNTAAWSGLGDAHLALGDYMEAENAYRAVTEIDPVNASGYYGLARAKAIQGKSDEAISAYRRAVSLNPALRERSQGDEFFDNIRKEIESLNTAADHNNQGDQLRDAGEIDQAIIEYQKAVTLDPSNATYHANLGKAYEQQGRLADAEAEFVTAISYASGNDKYYSLLGEVKFEGGDLQGAIDNYAKALDLNDQNPVYHARIAEIYAESGNLQATIDEYGKAIELDQNNPKYRFQFAQALTDFGNPEEAILQFEEVLNLDPDYSDAFCGLAMAQQDAGHIEDAQDNLAKCVELSTNELLINEAQQKFQD